MQEEEAPQGATDQQPVYMKNGSGTISKTTDPQEIARLRGLGWTEATPEEGVAAFAEKARAASAFLKPLGDVANNLPASKAPVPTVKK